MEASSSTHSLQRQVSDGNPKVLSLSFNQDRKCFTCGTETGFTVYNSDPLSRRFSREFVDGGIRTANMLFTTNILALVGGGKCPKYPPEKVMIWDDMQNKPIAEITFNSFVKGVRLRREWVVAVTQSKVYVYTLGKLELVTAVDTVPNLSGLCAITTTGEFVMACPGHRPGYVHVERMSGRIPKIIFAHNGPLACIALSVDGSLVATASDKGTLIRVFDSTTGIKIREFRRGLDRATIYCIDFSNDSKFIAVSSSTGTVHIFSIEAAENQKFSDAGIIKEFIPNYFLSGSSFAQFHIPDGRSMCAFLRHEPNAIIGITEIRFEVHSAPDAACENGAFYKYTFDDTKGGEATLVGYANFLTDSTTTTAKK